MDISIRDPFSIGRFLVARRGEPIVILNSDNPLYDVIKRFCTEISLVGRQEGVGPTWRGVKGRNEPIEYPPGSKPFRIVSFHTDDEIYTAAAARLKASADRLSIPIHIETAPSRGSWERNCAFKAEFVRDQWRNSDLPIVWLDADATLNADPSLFAALDADFAIYKSGGWEFRGGTLYFGRSPAAAAILDRWIKHCRNNPTQWDQVSLDYAWAEITREQPLRTVWLPENYCWRFYQEGRDKAVIIQWVASRQAKALAPAKKDRTLLRKAIDIGKRCVPRRVWNFLRTAVWHVKHRGKRRARRASRTA